MVVNWCISERFLFIILGDFSLNDIDGAVCYLVRSFNFPFKLKKDVFSDIYHHHYYNDIVNFYTFHI